MRATNKLFFLPGGINIQYLVRLWSDQCGQWEPDPLGIPRVMKWVKRDQNYPSAGTAEAELAERLRDRRLRDGQALLGAVLQVELDCDLAWELAEFSHPNFGVLREVDTHVCWLSSTFWHEFLLTWTRRPKRKLPCANPFTIILNCSDKPVATVVLFSGPWYGAM